MDTSIKTYLDKWTFMRLVQLLVGVFALWKFFSDGDDIFLIIGAVMSFQAILNVGCFSSKGCSTTSNTEPAPFTKNFRSIDEE